MYVICHALYMASICVYFTVLHGTIVLVYHALKVMMNIHIHVHVRTYICIFMYMYVHMLAHTLCLVLS